MESLVGCFVCLSIPQAKDFQGKNEETSIRRQQEPVYFSPKVEEYFQQLQLGGEAGLSKNLTLR